MPPPIVKAALAKVLGGPPAKAARVKAPAAPPANAQGGPPTAALAKAVPRPKQTLGELHNALADASGLQPQDAKRFLEALRNVAARSLRDTSAFKIHNLVLIRMRTIPPRNAVTRSMFGKRLRCRRNLRAKRLRPSQ